MVEGHTFLPRYVGARHMGRTVVCPYRFQP